MREKNKVYHVKGYTDRYVPLTKKGAPFKCIPPFLLIPNKPQGRGIRKLFRRAVAPLFSEGIAAEKDNVPEPIRRVTYFGIFILLLEESTQHSAAWLRGYLLNNDDQPAEIADIAEALKLEDHKEFLTHALDFLVKGMGWIELAPWPIIKPADPVKPVIVNEQEKAWLYFFNRFDRVIPIYSSDGKKELLTRSDYTSIKNIFKDHYRKCNNGEWDKRRNELIQIADRASDQASKPIAYFISEVKRIYG